MYDDGFPWIKFLILTIPMSLILLCFAPTLKWKLLFGLVASPLGVALALMGKSMRKRN